MCNRLCPRRPNTTNHRNTTKMSFWLTNLFQRNQHHPKDHPMFGQWSMFFLKILLSLVIIDRVLQNESSSTFAAIITNKDRPYTSIIYTAVDGGKVALPCNIIPPTIDDHVVLILWYKDDDFEPIYTIDARKDPLEKARIISSPNLIDRVYFNQHNQPAFLQIDPVQTRDAGEYRCRVDFKKARTVNIVIQLKVIVPPEEPIISYKYSESTSHPLKGLIGPFNEGDRLVLVCTSFGGKPRPTLTWWKDYSIIDDSFEYRSQDVTVNELVIESLARHHLLSIFTCQSTNNNITIASSASITIDLNLKPLEVKIRQLSASLLANADAKFECTSFGSKPKARLFWMFNEVRFDTTLQGDMQTISIISLPLKREHNGHILSCHAENPKIHNSTISEHFVLSVEYVPDLKLQLGISTISLQAIQEGNDIYFDCILDANPMPTTPIVWRFNDEILEPRPGIIQSNYSLVLQNVRRYMSGKYQCEATNKHGTTRSNPIDLSIRFAPYCKFKSTLAYGLSLFESNALVCEVDSNPMPTSFQWKFEKEIDLTSVRSHNFSSILYYRPNSTQHYGIIECMAKNDVGLQQIPCKYHIIDSGPPNFPFYCQLLNQSVDKITVRCTSEKFLMSNDVHQQYRTASANSEEMGLDNNGPRMHSTQPAERTEPIAQTIFVHPTTNYVAEVYDKHGRMLRNITLNPPMPFTNVSNLDLINRTRTSSSSTAFNFQIDNLMESSVYKIKIYALNSKGTSDQMWISAQTLRKAEKYVYSNFTETGLLFSNYALNHIKIIMVSVCGLLTIMLIVIVIAITYMSKYCQRLRRSKSANHRKSSSSSLKFPNNGSLSPSNTNNNDDDEDIILDEMDINQQHHSVHHHHHLQDVHENENRGYSLDNLAIPTVYTETNVICNEYYGNILASNSNNNNNNHHHHNANNNNGCYNGTSKEITKTVAAAANMELLSLDLYSMNSMDGSISGGSCTANTIAPKGPPDLIPTFYYNNERVRDLMNTTINT